MSLQLNNVVVKNCAGNSNTVNLEPLVDVLLNAFGETDTIDINVPAGAKYVRIENKGGLNPNAITVNGITLQPGDVFERDSNADIENRYLLPAYVVEKNGSLAMVYYETA